MQTTCPECGTAFRVAPAELAHRRGWVRCGRCSAPFDALAALADEPPGLRVESLSQPSAGPATQTPIQALDQGGTQAPAASAGQSASDAGNQAATTVFGTGTGTRPYLAEPPGVDVLDAPSILAPQKRSPAALFWGLGALMAFLLLCMQWALLLRLPLVAWWPESEPVIHRLCTSVACPPLENRWAGAVPRPYRLDHLELQRVPTDPHARTLHIRVRNEAPWTLPEPAFSVTLQAQHGRHEVFIPPTGGASTLTDLAPAEQRYRRVTVNHPHASDFTVSVRPVPALGELTGLQQDPIRLP